MNYNFLLLCSLLIFSSCSITKSKWVHLYEKPYCAAHHFIAYNFVPTSKNAFFDTSNINTFYPFLFKADSILFKKDSIVNFYEKSIPVDVITIKTNFLFPSSENYTIISKQKLAFDAFVTKEIDSTIYNKIIDNLINTHNYIRILSKGEHHIFELRPSEKELIYICQNYAIFIPLIDTPIEYSTQYRPQSFFLWVGLGIMYDYQTFFAPVEREQLYLNHETIRKLYQKH